VTGSGKTEVYLRLVEVAGRRPPGTDAGARNQPDAAARKRVAARFPDAGLVSLHSELTEAARTRNWRAALDGRRRIVLGTRLAVFTPLPRPAA
jgi:primosomal protein N' (replication factor Y)